MIFGLAVNIWASGCPGMKGETTAKSAETTTTVAPATFAGVVLDPQKCCTDYKGKCELLCLDIKGMTCIGCEEIITKTLTGTDGVIKVLAVDHKEGAGVVAIDPEKVKSDKVLAAIDGLGYKSKVLPRAPHSGCTATTSKSCTATCLKTGAKCPSMKATAATEEKKETKTDSK
jgi:copper chaperone CopZ